MVLTIQKGVALPPRRYLRSVALQMEVGDMIECKPSGRTGGNTHTSHLHRMLVNLGLKARSEKITACGACGAVKDMSIERKTCVDCGSAKLKVTVRTWRIA